MRSVLILGGRAPVALDLARRFAAQGWRVHVADSISFQLSGFSAAVQGRVRLPSPRFHGARFVRELSRYLQQQRIDLVVPTCEEVFFLSSFRSRLPAQVRVAVDELDKLRQLHSKLHFTLLAQGCGAAVPATHSVQTLEEAREWAAGRPVVLKPEFSRFGVFVRIYSQGIPGDAPQLEPLGNWAVQEFHAGTELCSYSVAESGRLLAHSVYEPRYRLGSSASFYFAPAQAAQIEQFVRTLIAKSCFTGQISFDWIRAADGECAVLECNPRATSGLHLFDTGAELPAALMGESGGLVHQENAAPKMIAAMMLSAGLWRSAQHGELAQWRRDFARAQDVLGIPGDRRPLMGAIADLASYARAARRDRCSMREAATRDIEWDGEVMPMELR